jgi:hypothetical protein
MRDKMTHQGIIAIATKRLVMLNEVKHLTVESRTSQ